MRAYVASVHQYLEGKLQTFARQRRQVIDFVLQLANGRPQSEQPFATSDTFALQLYAELTQFFELLSDSSYQMAEACRELVLELDLTSLLVAFSSSALQRTPPLPLAAGEPQPVGQWRPHGGHGALEADVRGGGYRGAGTDPMSNKQKDLIALTVKHLSHLLLRAEFGNHSASVPRAGGGGDSAYYHAQIRSDGQKIGHVVRVLENVNSSILQYITAPRSTEGATFADHKNVNDTLELVKHKTHHRGGAHRGSRRSQSREPETPAGEEKSAAASPKPAPQRSVVPYDEGQQARAGASGDAPAPAQYLPLHPLYLHRTLHYVYALNALVCLLHTIALPSFTDKTANSTSLTTWSSHEDMVRDAKRKANANYLAYLRALPLADFRRVLLRTKETLYALFEFDHGCALRGMSAARYVETHGLRSAPGAAAWDLQAHTTLVIGGSGGATAPPHGAPPSESTPTTPPTPHFSGGDHGALGGRLNGFSAGPANPTGRGSVPSTPQLGAESRRPPAAAAGGGGLARTAPTAGPPGSDRARYDTGADADGNRTIGSYMRQMEAPVVLQRPEPTGAVVTAPRQLASGSSSSSASPSLYHILFKEDLNTLDEMVRCAKIETANTLRTIKNLLDLISDN
ncbi:hypothetical protein STCU_10673 [Strigomonas culicis]|uniref:Uncharacterized protein n=1 Tax=Strigomonas culicis TaxID=28005 RepID=S9TLV4_9TRYP|nr:hypothetical protein STCU_10673 [Strigomonas culicis]|eukprot:EPY17348.1 hypothetical protein STCU_10673 [Strigomonas culicis]